MSMESPFARRRAGLLLHPTSLPGDYDNGDLGTHAYRFIDWLASCGFGVWQTLPLGPTHGDLSPYSAQSAHAGNPRLIALEPLIKAGWLSADDTPQAGEDGWNYRQRQLVAAHQGFQKHGGVERDAYAVFQRHHAHWLDDYALYQVIRAAQDCKPWFAWPRPLRERQAKALEELRHSSAESLDQYKFEQFLFFKQWGELKQYANERGILIFGDIPLFVGYDSADVWAQREAFLLDAQGARTVVAGVPPDYFSATGQLWGNPHYDWEAMRKNDFKWWKARIQTQLTHFDILRIDHFRGLEAYWEIPADAETAVHGRWQTAPGDALLKSLRKAFGELPLVAEDLGIITPEVEQLRDSHNLPGMKVLHFAFDSGSDNIYLPHNHVVNAVVYTGTHDNNTTLGWFNEIDGHTKQHLFNYLGGNAEQMPELLVRAALSSVAQLAVIPMQDALELGAEHRMNQPGVAQGCWRWRFQWEQVKPQIAGHYRYLLELYGRI